MQRYEEEPEEPCLMYNKEELESFHSIFKAFDKTDSGMISKADLLKVFETLQRDMDELNLIL